MRRREIQSFTLKLSELKEYESVRNERLETKSHLNKNTNTNMAQDSPMKLASKWGPKSKHEIHERIGMNSSS